MTKIVKNDDKEKYVYSDYVIAFDGKSEWGLAMTARNVIIFVVDNSSPSHASNLNFLTQFCLGSISNGFSVIDFREVSLNGNVHDFLLTVILINLTFYTFTSI